METTPHPQNPGRPSRPRPKLMRLTGAAARRVREIMAERGAGYLRISLKNGGCAGMEYTMDYVGEPAPLDERVCDQGVEILVEASAVMFLVGSVIDHEITPLHAKFVFNNPNETDACGCGESVTLAASEGLVGNR